MSLKFNTRRRIPALLWEVIISHSVSEARRDVTIMGFTVYAMIVLQILSNLG